MSSPVSRVPLNLKLKLSREMKVLLLLLLLVALIGGGYVWLSSRHTQALAGAPTPGTDPAGPPATGSADGQTAPDAGLRVQPDGQVDVPSIPAFGADPSTNAASPEAGAAPPPGGINPDTPLASLPSRNPFRPLELDASANPAAPSTPASPVSTSPITAAQPPVAPITPAAPEPLSGTTLAREDTPSAPVVIPPLPHAAEPVKVASAPVNGSAFPTSGGPAGTLVTLPPVSPANADREPSAPAPVRPPVAGVRVPGGGIDLNALLGQRPAGTSTTPGASGNGTVSRGTAPATALPTPELPQPITQLGADSAAASAPVSPLGDLVRRRELAFDAGVLGPVNTAIFRSKDGFVVVSAGQTLPNSNVVVRDVTATGATLALGPETKLLALDPR